MNAAARLVQQNVLSRHLVFTHLLTRRQFAACMLSLAIILSALSMIYITHTSRVLHAVLQHRFVERDQLSIQRSQLLLERSVWSMQNKTQQIAEHDLGMVTPAYKDTVVIHE